MIGRRLRQLRLARGLSLEALAAAIGGVVTKQSLSKYEQGKATPSPVVLNRLAEALEVKAAYLWSEPSIRVEFLAYRKGSALLKGEQARVEGLVAEGLETRVHLQQLLGQDNEIPLPVQVFPIEKLEDTEAAATALRNQWQLGLDPIANVTDVLERHSVHVLEIDAAGKFDGISAVAYDESGRKCSAAVVTCGAFLAKGSGLVWPMSLVIWYSKSRRVSIRKRLPSVSARPFWLLRLWSDKR